MKMAFKNALCLAEVPECREWGRLCGWSCRYRRCQRKRGHRGPHRSWSREWDDGEKESRKRSPLCKGLA
jgi:hypothetical protein